MEILFGAGRSINALFTCLMAGWEVRIGLNIEKWAKWALRDNG
jgi:hypothetical protein